jgi:hypothetical protein
MDGAEKYLLRQTIAASLDHPSVYMGGPSLQSVRKAIRIIEMLERDFEVDTRESLSDAVKRVKTWRTSPWDSLNRV